MKKAFTLVEMLVVIGILGILMGVLIGSVTSGTDSARAARCLTNMKNLASACQSYGMASGHFPLASSVEVMEVQRNGTRVDKRYSEIPGWISWNSQNAYSGGYTTSSAASPSWFTSTYSTDEDAREFALTNGVLWKYVSANRDLYVCPDHKIKMNGTPRWSYLMNSYFRWAGKDASAKGGAGYSGINFADLKRADRKLLFSEIQYVAGVYEPKVTNASGMDCDCTLQYKTDDNSECIGFNHSSGKKNLSAHVVFADGHTEKLAWPRSGMSLSELQDLTKWLCEGTDFSFDGNKYKELNN